MGGSSAKFPLPPAAERMLATESVTTKTSGRMTNRDASIPAGTSGKEHKEAKIFSTRFEYNVSLPSLSTEYGELISLLTCWAIIHASSEKTISDYTNLQVIVATHHLIEMVTGHKTSETILPYTELTGGKPSITHDPMIEPDKSFTGGARLLAVKADVMQALTRLFIQPDTMNSEKLDEIFNYYLDSSGERHRHVMPLAVDVHTAFLLVASWKYSAEEEYHVTYYNGRINAMLGEVNTKDEKLASVLVPSWWFCRAWHKMLSLSTQGRKALLSMVSDQARARNALRRIPYLQSLSLTKWTGLGYYALIDRYILQDFPEAMRHPGIKWEVLQYEKLRRAIGRLDANVAPYAAYLGESAVSGSSSKDYAVLQPLAVAIAKETNKSFANYMPGTIEQNPMAKELYEAYRLRNLCVIGDFRKDYDVTVGEPDEPQDGL